MRNILLFFLFSISGFSQNFTYYGNVNDKSGPVAGANICIKGTKNCTQSDFDGTYDIEVKIGDKLEISMIGLKTIEIAIIEKQSYRIDRDKIKVEKIENKDFLGKLKFQIDTAASSKNVGIFYTSDFQYWNYGSDLYRNENPIRLISVSKKNFYSFKQESSFNKLFLEFNNESSISQAIRLFDFQSSYSQGRSFAGVLTYQSPESNEIFSFGPNVNSLTFSNISTAFYQTGNIVNQQFGIGKAVDLFSENKFFNNAFNFKTSILATIKNPNQDYIQLKLNYNRGEIVIPNNKNQQIIGNFNFFKYLKNKHNISGSINFNSFENNLSNSNFVINKINLANAITPIHFDNKSNFILSNEQQRSFSKTQNNPYFLLNFNQDKIESNTFSFNSGYIFANDGNPFKSNILYQNSIVKNFNGTLPNAANSANSEYNIRNENYKLFTFTNSYKYDFRYEKFIETKLNYKYENRNLNRLFYEGFTSIYNFPNNGNLVNQTKNNQERHNLNWNVNGNYKIERIVDSRIDLIFTGSSDLNYSSTAKNDFLANYNIGATLENLLRYKINLFAFQSYSEIEPSIQNNNLNFNTLKFKLSDFNSINNNFELFSTSQNIATIEKQTSVGARFYSNNYEVNANFYFKNVSNLYAPTLENNQFIWKPAINYFQKGLEIDFKKNWFLRNNNQISVGLNFSTYRNAVTKIKSGQNRVAFAGFSDINKNYIEGEPLGVIVGNSYLKNANNQLIIDSEGFPIADLNPKIIGNPNPDFVIGFDNSVKIKKITFNMTFDWHHGGQIWNGTQQTLNFYGKSRLTENDRNIQNYVFDGVTQTGEPNTKSVNFYDSNLPIKKNRWVRYGIEGAAEDNIQDASYFRMSNFSISYDGNIKVKLLKFKISLFTNNVFIIAKSKTAFINNTLFNSSETTGLEYFNSPLTRSTGISINIKY